MALATRTVGLLALALMLAACGGGGGTTPGGPPPPPPPGPPPSPPPPGPATEFAAYIDRANDISDRAALLPSANPPPLPTSGRATYFGVFQTPLTGSPADTVAGNLSLSVAFNGSATTGGVTNLLNAADDAFTGSFAITDIRADRPGQQFGADIDGTITNPTGQAFTLDGELDGQFPLGPAFLFGTSDGTVTGPGGTTTVTGDFIAERN